MYVKSFLFKYFKLRNVTNIYLISGVLLYKLNPDPENFNSDKLNREMVVRVFVWAQWDPINQTLYYIHYRKPNKCLVEGDEAETKVDVKTTPTLSALQFHDDLPHETVVSKLTDLNFVYLIRYLNMTFVRFTVEHSLESSTCFQLGFFLWYLRGRHCPTADPRLLLGFDGIGSCEGLCMCLP